MRKNIAGLLFLLVIVWVAAAAAVGQKNAFPDLPGYRTLLGDFHTHTVFSDGEVWPTVRVREAVREGIDVIAITDHIEYQRHKEDVSTNRERPYEIAVKEAEKSGILLIRGAEISRSTPPGHYNAIFLKAVNPLAVDDFLDAVKAANQQGGFVFWNHHDWRGPARGNWTELQTQMLENGWLHGMEIVNKNDYYARAHQWCLEKNLTMLGNSDIHVPALWKEYTPDDHRNLTLVFAQERTVESVYEALRARRTAVWYRNRLIGRREHLEPLFQAAVEVSRTSEGKFRLNNRTCMNLELNLSGTKLVVPALSSAPIEIQRDEKANPLPLKLHVENFLVAPHEGLSTELVPASR